MALVVISVAHSDLSRGVVLDGSLDEHSVSLKQSNEVASILMADGHDVRVIDEPEGQGPDLVGQISVVNQINPDLAFEIHHNGSENRGAQYGLIIHGDGNPNGVLAAWSVVQELRGVVPWPVYAPKPASWVRNNRMTFISKTVCPALIIEPGFFTARSGAWYKNPYHVAEEAQAIGRGLSRYFDKPKETNR